MYIAGAVTRNTVAAVTCKVPRTLQELQVLHEVQGSGCADRSHIFVRDRAGVLQFSSGSPVFFVSLLHGIRQVILKHCFSQLESVLRLLHGTVSCASCGRRIGSVVNRCQFFLVVRPDQFLLHHHGPDLWLRNTPSRAGMACGTSNQRRVCRWQG